jgi:Spy/CpxP family protein refolding chaperone
LDLTDHQKGQLKPVLADEFKQMRAVGDDASLTQDQKREKMKQIHEASRPRVQAILTPEQQQKFARMNEEVKERRGEMNQAHGDSQPPQ